MTIEQVNELKRQHQNAVAVMREAVKDMKAEGVSEARAKELSDKFDKAEADSAKLEKEYQRGLSIIEAEKRTASWAFEQSEETEQREKTGRKPSEDQLKNQLDIFSRAMKYGTASLSTEEQREFNKAKVEMRGTNTQIVGTNSLGGYIVPILLQNEIIASMKDYSGVLQVARVFSTAGGGQITFPSKDLTARKAVKTAESGSIAINDITYGQKVMDAYKYTDALKFSWELMQDSEFDILGEMREAFAESFGRAANDTLTLGDGSDDPNGIVVASTLGVTAASATAITLAELIDLEHSVDPAYRRRNTSGYMFNDVVLKAIKKLSLADTGSGAGVWQPSFRDGAPATVNGYNYWINQDMDSSINAASKLVLFGDFDKYRVRMVKDMTVMRNDMLHMATGEVAFYAFSRWDGELMDTAAVKHLITAAS